MAFRITKKLKIIKGDRTSWKDWIFPSLDDPSPQQSEDDDNVDGHKENQEDSGSTKNLEERFLNQFSESSSSNDQNLNEKTHKLCEEYYNSVSSDRKSYDTRLQALIPLSTIIFTSLIAVTINNGLRSDFVSLTEVFTFIFSFYLLLQFASAIIASLSGLHIKDIFSPDLDECIPKINESESEFFNRRTQTFISAIYSELNARDSKVSELKVAIIAFQNAIIASILYGFISVLVLCYNYTFPEKINPDNKNETFPNQYNWILNNSFNVKSPIQISTEIFNKELGLPASILFKNDNLISNRKYTIIQNKKCSHVNMHSVGCSK